MKPTQLFHFPNNPDLSSTAPVISPSWYLFLRVGGLLSSGLGALLAHTNEAGVRAGLAESAVSVLGGLDVRDSSLLELDGVDDGESLAGVADDVLALLGGLDLLGGSVTLGLLAVAAGEEDETLPVLLEALDVGLEGLLAQVLTARVNGNADGGSELAGNASSLEITR